MMTQQVNDTVRITIRNQQRALAEIYRKHATESRPFTNDVNGEVPCPQCGGVLHYRIAAHSAHLSAACETDGCLGWMM
jgi:hypothetical protein